MDTDFRRGENLRKFDMFENLSDDELSLIAKETVVRRFGPREMVCEEGSASETMFFIESGSVSVAKQGVTLAGEPHRNGAQFLFTRLNEVKPPMVEEATGKAREVALKFAQDSNSRLGKIRRASQGQFSISDRDKNNPHIKKVRVVSTVEYYLSD